VEYDVDLVLLKKPTVEFFKDKQFEIISCCMRIQPNTRGLSKEDCLKVRKEAINMVAQNHEFGPYRNLCKTCNNDFAECDSDPMFGHLGVNVCYCKQYKGEISPEDVAGGIGIPS